MPPIRHISTINPVRPSERCGVSTAENNVGSSLAALSAAIAVLYTDKMAKRTTRRNRAPARRKRAAPRKQKRVAKKSTRLATTARVRRPPKAAMAAVAAGKTMSAWTADEIETAFRRFAAANPDPRGELKHVDPYTLLVAVVLSAQATDAGVNKATGPLFQVASTPAAMVALGEEKLRDYIKTIGLFNTKAKNVIALSQQLVERYGGKVPHDREALEALPGVGRKSANVVLNTAFGEPTIAVDTHIFRLGNRTGIAPGLTPFEVEVKLNEVVPDRYKLHAHHWLILHGRYICKATKPACDRCIIADLCKWPEKTADAAPPGTAL
ncbi:MAG: endonuclease III [Hyphomicrobiales bacterium]|nr:endonuclease III [Hyphomicrobiales bacterium]